MNKLIRFALTLTLLSCVFGTGIYVGRSYDAHPLPRFKQNPAFRQRLLNNFAHKLNLTKEQKISLESVLESQRTKFESLRTEIHPKFEEMHKETQMLIRNILNEQQQSKFDEIKDELMPNPLKRMHRDYRDTHHDKNRHKIWPDSDMKMEERTE